ACGTLMSGAAPATDIAGILVAPNSCARPSHAALPGSVAELSCQKIVLDLQLANLSIQQIDLSIIDGSLCPSSTLEDARRTDQRRQQRLLQSQPIAEAWAAWAEQTVRQLSRKSELAAAFRYLRGRWTALVRCFDDGRLALDNNPAERPLRCVAIGRKNYRF